jgi:hypothetical protein
LQAIFVYPLGQSIGFIEWSFAPEYFIISTSSYCIMSRHYDKGHNYEIVDADETITSADFLPTSNTNNQGHSPTIPSREAIDAKNTLQSFDSKLPTPAVLPAAGSVHAFAIDTQPTLPTGEAIDGKNTLRTFDSNKLTPSAESICIPTTDLQPTIPTGEAIDFKNTLRTFDSNRPTPDVEIIPIPDTDMQPTIPNGEAINAKNTLQSFYKNEESNGQTVPHSASNDSMQELVRASTVSPGELSLEETAESSTVVAVALEAENNVVYAELAAGSNTIAPGSGDGLPTRPWYKNVTNILLLALIAVLAPVGLVVYFGLSGRNDSSGQGANSSPTNSPIAVLSSAPTVAMPSLSPSISQDTLNMRAEALTSYINNITLLNQTIAINGTSPESLALSWMITNDTALDTIELTNVNEISSSSIGFKVRQRFPLLVMWFQQTETEVWAITEGWLVDPDECNWYGITCDLIYDANSNKTQNAIVQITYDGISSYVGVIPWDFGLLSYLQHAEWKDSRENEKNAKKLQGTLPETIGLLTRMTSFSIMDNALTGTLPDSVGQWTLLTYFTIQHTGLFGTMPSTIGLWTSLTYFDVSINSNLTGTIPDSIGQWTAMTFFANYLNSLSGTLPDSIGQWADIFVFEVAYNRLMGTLPDTIGQWTTISLFDVSANVLTGSIPSSIGNWSAIGEAYFDFNDFTGTMPYAICDFIEQGDSLWADCSINCTCCTECNSLRKI